MDEERATGATEILLRPVSAESDAASSGNDEKPNFFRRQLKAPTTD
jgi:hypothetical protein